MGLRENSRIIFLTPHQPTGVSLSRFIGKFVHFAFILGIGLFLAQVSWGGTLDSLRIKQLYRDGEFENCTAQLERLLRSPQKLDSREIAFANKYLGVIYCANPATEERGRYYLNQFIEIRPNENILDLYTSKKIKEIFNEVLAEYRAAHPETITSETPSPKPEPIVPTMATPSAVEARKPIPRPIPAASQKPSSSHAWWWIAGTAVVAGAAATGYFVYSTPEKKITTREYLLTEE